MRNAALLRLTTILALLLAACGGNLFQNGEKADPAEDATLALERKDPSKAIQILEDALADDPENPQLTSILATAYAQRAGIEPLSFAQRMSSNNSSSSSSDTDTATATDTSTATSTSSGSGGLVALFDVMPEASEDNLADIDKALELLASIASDERIPGDEFKYAIYQTASMVMHMKALDKNGDGQLSIDEITNLSDTSAAGLLNQLASAAVLLGGGNPDDKTMQKAQAAIVKYQDQIDAAPGASTEEKTPELPRNLVGGGDVDGDGDGYRDWYDAVSELTARASRIGSRYVRPRTGRVLRADLASYALSVTRQMLVVLASYTWPALRAARHSSRIKSDLAHASALLGSAIG